MTSSPAPEPEGVTSPRRAGEGATIRAALALPITVGLLVPALIIAVDPWRQGLEGPSVAIGAVLTLTGLAIVVRAGREVTVSGGGTLTPWGPARLPITTGLFAHCRNPMYLGVLSILAGLSMASRSPLLGLYLLTATVGFHLQITRREEPWAARAFPTDWPAYRDRVPRWFPGLGR